MVNETLARRSQTQPDSVAESDYRSFCAALGASARGRAFLNEYARRNRHADTEVVLEALGRLERSARRQETAPEAERIRQDLRALLDTLRTARPQIDNGPGAIKAATLAALIDFVQARIEGLLTPAHPGLSQVPELEQPELPIPQPASMAPQPITLVPPSADRQKLAAATNRLDSASPADIVSDVKFIDIALVKPQPLDLTQATELPALDSAMPAPAGPAIQRSAAPVVPTEAYEVWLDQPAAIQFDVAIGVEVETTTSFSTDIVADETTSKAADEAAGSTTLETTGLPENAVAEAPVELAANLFDAGDTTVPATDAPVVSLTVSPAVPAAASPSAVAARPVQNSLPVFGPPIPNPTGLSPRQLAIAALAAQNKPHQPAAAFTSAPVTNASPVAEDAPVAVETTAPAVLSPRQIAIAALAAQNKTLQPATVSAPQQPVAAEAPAALQAAASVVEQPAAKSGPLSPRQAAIAALAAQNKLQQPATEVAEQVPGPATVSVDAIADALLKMQREAELGEADLRETTLDETKLETKAEIQLAAAIAPANETSLPETSVTETSMAETPAPETPAAATTAASPAKWATSVADPLDAILSLSDDERIALFT